MSSSPPKCRTATLFAFSGDRTPSFATRIFKSLREGQAGRSPGPSIVDCLLFLGHVGVSLDSGPTIWGFNPDTSGVSTWRAMNLLRRGEALPGIVSDDTQLFAEAQNRRLSTASFQIVLPEPQFDDFRRKLDLERSKSDYSYGFPNGDGDCNCIMHQMSSSLFQDVQRLGELAMSFRGTRSDDERRAIANDYCQTVERLIQSGNWQEVPSFEDQLPDDWMPQAFYDYWTEQAGE